MYNLFQATCSLNYLPFLPQAGGWCPPSAAPPPTKHNILCAGKSAKTIIEAHGDFNASRHRAAASQLGETTFDIVRAPPPQYVILLETSSSMARVWKWVRKGLQSLIRSGRLCDLIIIIS